MFQRLSDKSNNWLFFSLIRPFFPSQRTRYAISFSANNARPQATKYLWLWRSAHCRTGCESWPRHPRNSAARGVHGKTKIAVKSCPNRPVLINRTMEKRRPRNAPDFRSWSRLSSSSISASDNWRWSNCVTVPLSKSYPHSQCRAVSGWSRRQFGHSLATNNDFPVLTREVFQA